MGKLRLIAALLTCSVSTGADLVAAEQGAVGRQQVQRALATVDRWLAGSQYTDAWNKRLDTDALRRELAKTGSPDSVVLKTWLRRLGTDGRLAEYAPLLNLQRSVEGWLALESLPHGRHLPAVAMSILRSPSGNAAKLARLASDNGETQQGPSRAALRNHLIALAAMLARYAERPSDALAQSIQDELGWLDAAGQAPTLVAAVRQYYGHPNVWIDVSEDLLDDPVVRTIERLEPVRDVILGSPVSGNSRLHAQSDLVIEPAADRAILKIVVHGHVDCQTTGRSGPARIHSRSRTAFRAEKSLVIDETGLRILPTLCEAELSEDNSQVAAVQGGLRGRIIRRIAQRRWEASQSAAHEEAARHVEQRVSAAVDKEAGELIARLDRFVLGPMFVLAGAGPARPLRFCTEKGVLRIGLLRGQLGAPSGMPPVDARRLFTLRVHSSLANRMAALALADAPSLPDLTFFTPAGALESIAVLAEPGRLLRQPLGPNAAGIRSPFSTRFWQNLAWSWIDQTVAPRLDGGGIVLRSGKWGRLTPGELASEWPLLGWQPVAYLAEPETTLR